MRVLVIDDDVHVCEILRQYLSDEGYDVDCASTAGAGLQALGHHTYDLIVLDLRLPDASGIDVFPKIREQSNASVIMLTSCASETDTVLGLELGADDYITKPFSPRTVLARIRTVLRRSRPGAAAGAPEIAIGDLSIDTEAMEVRKAGESVALTRTEFQILALLARRPGRTFPRAELLDAIHADEETLDRTLDKHINNLRRKLELDPRIPAYILTVHGIGYKMARQPYASAARRE